MMVLTVSAETLEIINNTEFYVTHCVSFLVLK